jgi:sigma-B regulation protein RsbU (phosphoserine phosphatase)
MTVNGEDALQGFLSALLEDDAVDLYDRAPCGYLSTTPGGYIVKANATFLRLLGYDRGEIVGERRFAQLLSPGGQIYFETHFDPMLRMHGQVRELALDLVRKDGTRLPALVNAALERDSSGEAAIIRIAVFDATHRREYERELLLAKERAEASEAHARSLARTLQQTLIPPTPPSVPGLDVAARYRPAGDGDEVGGDFYDVFQVESHDWVVALGDVCGKGAEAAAVTALARHTLRAAVVQEASPASALVALNDALLRSDTDRFCTVALLRIRRTNGTWTGRFGSAGHPAPLLRTGTEVTPLGLTGSALGLFDHVDVADVPVSLAPGDGLLLFTDGVPEGRREREFYGEARVADIMRQDWADADALVQRVLDDVLRFQSGNARDDIALVAVAVPAV